MISLTVSSDLANLLSRSVLKPLAVDALHGEALHVHALQELLLYLLLDTAPEFAQRVWRRRFFVVAGNGSCIDLLLDWRFACGGLGSISRPVVLIADAQHRLADLHDHSAVERYGAIYLLTVYVCPVCTMEVFDNGLSVPHGQDRVTLGYVGKAKADGARGIAPYHVGSVRERAGFAISAYEGSKDHRYLPPSFCWRLRLSSSISWRIFR